MRLAVGPRAVCEQETARYETRKSVSVSPRHLAGHTTPNGKRLKLFALVRSTSAVHHDYQYQHSGSLLQFVALQFLAQCNDDTVHCLYVLDR